jgi:poly-gamma-glutamate capsule biosynthesis protein CapA/YwtB (metallophosphatase superfamily)
MISPLAFLWAILSTALAQQKPAGPLPAQRTKDGSALYRAITREFGIGAMEDTVRIAVVGDLMCHSTQFQAAKTDNGYDFRPAFQAVKPYLSAADLTFGNLETVTAGASEKFTGYPMFNTPVEYLDALSDAGFDVLTTANNHSLDRRFPGVERTIEALEARGLMHTGTARTAEERDRPLIVTVKGLRLGILAYSYGTNGIPIPQGKPFSVNLIDTLVMAGDIRRVRAQGADAIAVFLHWGLEYERFPNANQKSVAEFLARQEVSLIMGSHPHVLQPAGWIGAPGSGSFVIYSLGNFFSGQRKIYTDAGIILQLNLLRDRTTGKVRTGDVRFIPTYVSTIQGYRILPVADALQQAHAMEASARSAMATDLIRMRAIWSETCTHLSDSAAGILPYR